MMASLVHSPQTRGRLTVSGSTRLVLEAGLDGDLQAVGDALPVLPDVVHQQAAERGHAGADWEAQVGDARVQLGLGPGGFCRRRSAEEERGGEGEGPG